MKLAGAAKIQFNHPLLRVLIGLLLFLQLVAPYQGWLILLVGLGGGWLISAFWAQSLARGLSLRREVRLEWVQVGDYLEEAFVLTNQGWARALGLKFSINLTCLIIKPVAWLALKVTVIRSGKRKAFACAGAFLLSAQLTFGPAILWACIPLPFIIPAQPP